MGGGNHPVMKKMIEAVGQIEASKSKTQTQQQGSGVLAESPFMNDARQKTTGGNTVSEKNQVLLQRSKRMSFLANTVRKTLLGQ